MCGILGIFGTNHKFANDALERLSHRGPDNTGFWTGENVFLGHKRLSIIDLNVRSNQPFHYKHFVLIYNDCLIFEHTVVHTYFD